MKLPARFKLSNSTEKIEIDVSNRTVVRVMIVVVLTLLGLAVLEKISSALILIFTAFFLALALNAPVHWLSLHLPGKRRGSRTVATVISFLIVVILLVGFLSLVLPPAIRQTSSFIGSIPELAMNATDANSPIGRFIEDNNLRAATNNLSGEVTGIFKSSGSHALSTLGKLSSSLFAIVTVLAMTFMMLVEGPRWLGLAYQFIPEDKHGRVTIVTRDMYKVIRGYVNGQITLAAIASVMILPAMLILGIPYAGALAVVVFICGLIPMIGHFIGATVVTLMALLVSPVTALLILAYYILYQQIENYVIQPRIQSSATNLSPLLVFISVIIGVNLNGLLGGLVSIPIAGCIRILILDYLQYRGKVLEDYEPKSITNGTR